MSTQNEGREKRPLRAGGCTLQLRQSRSGQYIRSIMPSLNRGWQNRWFYLQNDHGLLPEYTGKMVMECPNKWWWRAPAVEHKKLDPLLEAVAKVLRDGVTTATVAVAFHKRSVLPLAQRVLTMWEMTLDVSPVRTWMLEEPVPASEITLRLSKTVSSELKNYRVISMRPKRGYISLVRYFRPHLCFVDFFSILVFIWLAIFL